MLFSHADEVQMAQVQMPHGECLHVIELGQLRDANSQFI